MINFNTSQATNTFSVYPESSSLYANSSSGSFYVELIQSMDLSSGSFEVSLLNTPTEFSPRLTLQATDIEPKITGQYTFKLFEKVTGERLTWGATHTQWSQLHQKWSDVTSGGLIGRLIDTDRAYVQGDNNPTITTYSTSNEEGAFTTYND